TNIYRNRIGSSFATIAGGYRNEITGSAWAAAIGGGFANQAREGANYAVIPGGQSNVVAGAHAFAAGLAARAEHSGSFVWADSTGLPLSTTVNDQMLLRASGGVRIYSDASHASGVRLNAGANSWSMISDRHVKENFREIDKRAVLGKVARLPITEWNLITQEPSIRHVGPMAQDFQAAFGLGESDRHIDTSDAHGIALAALQGLNEIVEEKEARISALERRLAELESRLSALLERKTEAP
ncbi:MAG TPA: tail fiber domain-containing protein, partial [Verrucomicrobiae bacterium]|nr:tail fiber domain-containing protein [Verrucomicrobiae bacterium]